MNNDDFKRFYSALGIYAEQLNQQLIEADCSATELARRQGRIQALSRVITAVATSSEMIQRYRAPKD